VSGYEILSIDDLDRYPSTSASHILRPLRRRLGFRPFGLNVWEGPNVGDQVIERHRETDGAEELYVVLRGSAHFTLGEETFDAPAGTLVHAPPGTLREAVAAEEGTVVLAAGAKPGVPFDPAPWEEFAIAFSHARRGEVDAARAAIADVLKRYPDTWQGEYNAACFEALHGDDDTAFAHLRRAHRLASDGVAQFAEGDDDFAAMRGDPRWQELFA
jgi:hypothetical protein